MDLKLGAAAIATACLALPPGASAASPKPQTLVSFNGRNGNEPQAALIADAAANLYGVTQAGGSAAKGTVFELSPPASGQTAWTTTVLFTFTGANGSQPVAGLVFDKAGNLYGTTLTGGASGDGAVFELVAPAAGQKTWREQILVSFSGADGAYPQAGVIFDGSGNLYGATVNGGTSSAGTVFKLSPPPNGQSAWTLSTLLSFNGSAGGAYPTGTLIMDKAGNLYGTAIKGGTADDGVAWALSPVSGGGTPWTETVLASFGGSAGANPYAGLVADSAGNLYGTAANGGASGKGTVFKLTPPFTGAPHVLIAFKGTNGDYPFANLAIDPTGNLFGTTQNGGKTGNGLVFEASPPAAGQSKWTETVLAAFSGKDGAFPDGAVAIDAAGTLFGTTLNGGAHNDGSVFELTP